MTYSQQPQPLSTMSTTSTTPAKKTQIVDIVDIVEGGLPGWPANTNHTCGIQHNPPTTTMKQSDIAVRITRGAMTPEGPKKFAGPSRAFSSAGNANRVIALVNKFQIR